MGKRAAAVNTPTPKEQVVSLHRGSYISQSALNTVLQSVRGEGAVTFPKNQYGVVVANKCMYMVLYITCAE